MLLTTYRHAFRAPEINYPKKLKPGEDPCICPIIIEDENKKQNPNCPPVDVSSKANAVNIDCSDLMKPQATHNPCGFDTTGRYLGNMRSVYPDLYEKIKNIPSAELNRILENDANQTTYIVDYCQSKEYGSGGLFEGEIKRKKNVCGEDTKPWESKVDPEDFKCYSSFRPYKPKQNVEPQKQSIESNQLITEYMDKFSRTGCVILKSNIHTHKKCPSPASCKHPLKHCPIIY